MSQLQLDLQPISESELAVELPLNAFPPHSIGTFSERETDGPGYPPYYDTLSKPDEIANTSFADTMVQVRPDAFYVVEFDNGSCVQAGDNILRLILTRNGVYAGHFPDLSTIDPQDLRRLLSQLQLVGFANNLLDARNKNFTVTLPDDTRAPAYHAGNYADRNIGDEINQAIIRSGDRPATEIPPTFPFLPRENDHSGYVAGDELPPYVKLHQIDRYQPALKGVQAASSILQTKI